MPERTTDELLAGLDHVRAAPTDAGPIRLIVVRPAIDERALPHQVELHPASGVVGDNWGDRPSRRSADGGPHPDMQVTFMNARVAALVAGDEARWPEAGDQFYVDLDLSAGNLPVGTRLQLGTAVVEVTDQPHTGCAKFARRFGADAGRLVNSPEGRELRLRGMNARVVVGGHVATGELVTRA